MSFFARSIAAFGVTLVLAAHALAQSAPPQPQSQPAPAEEQTAPSASPPAVAAPPTIAPSAPATEVVENPYGFTALWQGGDVVARGTLIVLLIMSMGSWYVIVTKLIEQTMLSAQARAARAFWSGPSIAEAAQTLGRRSAFRMMVEDGLRATEHLEGTLVEQIDTPTWISLSLQHSVDSITSRLQRGLAFLATVGSTAPFVGLFGTVWGIYHALTEIGIAGQASIDKVAGPVGEALIMTAMGLAVAVPAVLGYNWLVRRNKAVLDGVRSFAADLLALFNAAPRQGARPIARTA
jgi:biopolymer transport protein ExbB